MNERQRPIMTRAELDELDEKRERRMHRLTIFGTVAGIVLVCALAYIFTVGLIDIIT